MLRNRLCIFVLLLACAFALAAPPAELEKTITRRLNDASLKGATIGIVVQSLEDGAFWYTKNEDKAFIPASTAKVITAVLALEYLKPEYRFSTRIYTNGTITDGVLDGDLYVQGGGDPSLVPEDLVELANTLAVGDPEKNIAPIKQINGRLMLDGSFFPRPGPLLGQGWEAGDLPWYYAAPASALSCSRNAVTVTVHGTTPGKPAEITLTPSTKLFKVVHKAMTRAEVRTGAVEVIPNGYQILVTGRVAPGAELVEKVSVPNPERLLAEQFKLALCAAGITIGEVAQGAVDPQQTLLAEHYSPPLTHIVTTMLKESDNHTAEQLRWTLLALYSLERPLSERYPAMLQDFATHSGLLIDGINMVDGSGLSRGNQVDPQGLVRILCHVASSSYYDAFYQALPIAGVDGTMKKRLVDTPAMGNAHVKTGTMRSVCTLAGYVTTAGGEHVVFAIMVNGYQSKATAARKLQDDIVSYLAGLPAAPESPDCVIPPAPLPAVNE